MFPQQYCNIISSFIRTIIILLSHFQLLGARIGSPFFFGLPNSILLFLAKFAIALWLQLIWLRHTEFSYQSSSLYNPTNHDRFFDNISSNKAGEIFSLLSETISTNTIQIWSGKEIRENICVVIVTAMAKVTYNIAKSIFKTSPTFPSIKRRRFVLKKLTRKLNLNMIISSENLRPFWIGRYYIGYT